jgi:predicted NUDIX family NTP pyrophosphohydrolase
MREFPEVDQVEWVSIDRARRKLVKGQTSFMNALLEAIAPPSDGSDRGSTTPAPD